MKNVISLVMKYTKKIGYLCVAAICLIIIAVYVYFVLDMYLFEYKFLYDFLGFTGIFLLLYIFIGAIIIFWILCSPRHRKLWHIMHLGNLLLLLWFFVLLWEFDWILHENPVTSNIPIKFGFEKWTGKILNNDAPKKYDSFSIELGFNIKNPIKQEMFRIMLERIVSNRPAIYSENEIIKSIISYSRKYDVEPILLLYWLYLCSYYGNATSGKIPFLKSMTSETVRDFVQVHLPSWFVESSLRKFLINSNFMERFYFMGHSGHLWRYAFQKATYDVSLEPYDANIYTDVFLVLREYYEEFPEIFSKNLLAGVDIYLRDSFLKLERVLSNSYSEFYEIPSWDADIYLQYREPLIIFARAVFYKIELDIDFATKVQALVARYYNNEYQKRLGKEFWNKVPKAQKVALVAMLRDVYTPNIGKSSYNVYNLPEFNLAPFYFVINEILKEPKSLLDEEKIWKPMETWKLWAAATTKLAVLSEVWQICYNYPLPGVLPSNTIKDAKIVVDGQAK